MGFDFIGGRFAMCGAYDQIPCVPVPAGQLTPKIVLLADVVELDH